MGWLPCHNNYARYKRRNWYLLQIQRRSPKNHGGTLLFNIIESIFLYFYKYFKETSSFSRCFLQQYIIMCTGILHRGSINEYYTSLHCFGRIFHVRHYVARRVRRKLHLRDAVCRDKRIISTRDGVCMLRILTSIFQVASDQCLRGKSHNITKNIVYNRLQISMVHIWRYYIYVLVFRKAFWSKN